MEDAKMEDIMRKVKSMDIDEEEWSRIHQWQRTFRKDNGVTISELLIKCDIEDVAAYRQFLCQSGIYRIPSKREGSLGKEVYDKLKIASEKDDFKVENKVNNKAKRKVNNQVEIVNDRYYDNDKDLIDAGILDLLFFLKENILQADIMVANEVTRDEEFVIKILNEKLGCNLSKETASISFFMYC